MTIKNYPLKTHFLIIGLITLLLNMPVFFKTLLTDMITYVLVGRKLADGYLMYRDAVDSKPPLIYYTYAAAHFISANHDIIIIKLLTIAAIIVSAILIYYITRSLFTPQTALAALYVFILAMHCGIAEEQLASNTEIYMNLFILAGLYFFTKNKFDIGPRGLFLTGLFIGIGFLYRYQAGLVTPVIGLILFLRHRFTIRFFQSSLLAAAGFLLPFTAALVFFYAAGAFDDFIFWSFTYNFFYIKAGLAKSDSLINLLKILAVSGEQIITLVMSVIFIILVYRKRTFSKEHMFIIALMLISVGSWGIGGRYYLHYFIQAIPFLAISASCAFIFLKKYTRISASFASLLLIMAFSFWIFNLVHYQPYLNEKDENPLVTKFIKENTNPDEKIFLWGTPKQIYYYSGHLFATRFVHTNYQTGKIWGTIHNTAAATPTMNKPLEVAESWTMLLNDLEKEKPRLIIDFSDDSAFAVKNYPAISSFTDKFYSRTNVGGRNIFVRNK